VAIRVEKEEGKKVSTIEIAKANGAHGLITVMEQEDGSTLATNG
jgi:hypothetical protein